MTQTLTKAHFDQTVRKIFATVATRDDLKEITREVHELAKNFDVLQTSVDRQLKHSDTQRDELVVLRARFDRLRDFLVKKGLATEEELSVIGGA